MKTLKKTLTFTALLFGLLLSFANPNLDKGDRIAISDASGELLYSGRVYNKGNIYSFFDFSKLKDGKYTVEVNKSFSIEINTIIVKNNTVKVLENSERRLYKPVFRVESDLVLVSKIAAEKENIEIQLFYENELIYTDKIDSTEPIINRVYRLDANKKGAYKAIIKTKERTYKEHFEL